MRKEGVDKEEVTLSGPTKSIRTYLRRGAPGYMLYNKYGMLKVGC